MPMQMILKKHFVSLLCNTILIRKGEIKLNFKKLMKLMELSEMNRKNNNTICIDSEEVEWVDSDEELEVFEGSVGSEEELEEVLK